MTCCDTCYQLNPENGPAGIYTKSDGTTVSWFYPNGAQVPASEAALIAELVSLVNADTDGKLVVKCKCKDSACWKDKFIEGGLDNTFTNFKHTSQQYTVTFSNGDVDTFGVASATSWSDQVQQMANGLGSIMPWAVDVDSYCNVLPNGCGGLQAPVVALNQMIARYVGFMACPADKVPVSITYVSDQSEKPKDLIVQYVETPIIWLDRCFTCGVGETFYLRGTAEEYTPICAVPCSHIYPEVPLAACSSSFQSGCDNLGNEDQSDNVAITAVYQDCGNGVEISYMIDDGEGGLIPYELIGQFVDCDSGEVVPDPETECQTTLCDLAVECGAGNIWTLFSKLELAAQSSFSGIVQVGDISSTSGSTHPELGYSINGWNIYTICSDTKPATDSNGHDWISGAPDSFSTVKFVRSNPDSVCGGKALLNKICNVDELAAAIGEASQSTHVIEGCIAVGGELVSAYTVIDDNGDALFPPKPLSDLGFNPDCCEIAKTKEVK